MKKLQITLFTMFWLAILCPVSGLGQPAPQLTDLQVVGVRSSNYPSWDPVSTYQILTTADHGGLSLQVQTGEIGYANPSLLFATFNGQPMTQVASQPILSGNTIIGYYRLWQLNFTQSFTSGQFVYKATSVNSPYTQKSDWVNIK